MTTSKGPPSEFGLRLRHVREVAGLSTKQLDRLADLSEGHVSTLEHRDRPNVYAHVLLLLCDVLGCTMDYLFAGRGKQPPANDIIAAVKRRESRPFVPRERQPKGIQPVANRRRSKAR